MSKHESDHEVPEIAMKKQRTSSHESLKIEDVGLTQEAAEETCWDDKQLIVNAPECKKQKATIITETWMGIDDNNDHTKKMFALLDGTQNTVVKPYQYIHQEFETSVIEHTTVNGNSFTNKPVDPEYIRVILSTPFKGDVSDPKNYESVITRIHQTVNHTPDKSVGVPVMNFLISSHTTDEEFLDLVKRSIGITMPNAGILMYTPDGKYENIIQIAKGSTIMCSPIFKTPVLDNVCLFLSRPRAALNGKIVLFETNLKPKTEEQKWDYIRATGRNVLIHMPTCHQCVEKDAQLSKQTRYNIMLDYVCDRLEIPPAVRNTLMCINQVGHPLKVEKIFTAPSDHIRIFISRHLSIIPLVATQ